MCVHYTLYTSITDSAGGAGAAGRGQDWAPREVRRPPLHRAPEPASTENYTCGVSSARPSSRGSLGAPGPGSVGLGRRRGGTRLRRLQSGWRDSADPTRPDCGHRWPERTPHPGAGREAAGGPLALLGASGGLPPPAVTRPPRPRSPPAPGQGGPGRRLGPVRPLFQIKKDSSCPPSASTVRLGKKPRHGWDPTSRPGSALQAFQNLPRATRALPCALRAPHPARSAPAHGPRACLPPGV